MLQHVGMSFDYVLHFHRECINWGFITIKKVAIIADLFSFGSSRLLHPQCWWIGFPIIPDLMLYYQKNVVSIYLLHAFVPVIVMHMFLETIWE